MTPVHLTLNIFVAMESEKDQVFAEDLRNAFSHLPFDVRICDVDRLQAAASDGPLSHLATLGIPVFVLSFASLEAASRRGFIATGDPLLGRPSHVRRYYICRDTSPSELLRRHPDLSRLARETMLVDRSGIPQIVADLEDYAASPAFRATLGGLLLSSLFLLATPLLLLLGVVAQVTRRIGSLLFIAGFLAGVVLLLLMSTGFAPSWWLPCALLSLFTAGVSFSNVETLDFWPRLGPRWKAAGSGSATPCCCDQGQLLDALTKWHHDRDWVAILRVVAFTFTLGPPLTLFIMNEAGSYQLYGIALVAGMAFPGVSAVLARRRALHEASYRGLTDRHMARMERLVARLSVSPTPVLYGINEDALAPFTPEESTRIRQWMAVVALSGNCAFSWPWRRPRDRVFVSYAWADDVDLGMSLALATVLESAGVHHYVDKRPIESGFVGWRTNVAKELEQTTHVFLIVSPSIRQAAVLADEMRTIVYRWFLEALPSVICVVDPGVTARIVGDPSSPLHLRFFLTWCPRMTFQEAKDARLVKEIIAQRRRQGRLRDWGSLIWPGQAARRARASLVAVAGTPSLERTA